MAQIAPVNAMICTDVNRDGIPDVIIAGNEYQASVDPGRYDASNGLLLLGDGKGGFKTVPPAVSGLILDGDIRDLKLIRIDKQQVLLTAVNDDKMKAFLIKK
jgi:enediyne biosynthesis protein E4